MEVDIVMNGDTPLSRAHDLSQQLQDKIEMLPGVGRAFVHVDHETTHRPVSTDVSFKKHRLTTGRSIADRIHSYSEVNHELLYAYMHNIWACVIVCAAKECYINNQCCFNTLTI